MKRANLTDSVIDSLPKTKGRQVINDMIIKPLKLVITSGSKTWVYRDSRTYKTLGQYPLIDTTTARQAALGMMQGTALPMLPIQPIVLGKQDDTTSGNACEPLATLAQAVAEYVESRKLADTTAKQFTGVTRAMSEYAHSPIDQLTPDVFTQWHQEKVKAGRGAMAALNGRYIRALFRWAAVRYDRPDLTDPTIKVRALTGASFNTKAKDTRLTEATLGCWWQLVSACEPLAVRVLLITYLLTGARKSELLELHTRDVSRPDGGRVCLQLNDTKNGTTHRLQLGQWLSQQWDTLLMASPDGLLFAGQAGRLRANVERISEKMGAAGVGLHDLRRSFTSFAHAAGVEMATLKALVNHTPTGGDVTTRHYLRVTPDAMRDAWQRVESYIIANATEKAA